MCDALVIVWLSYGKSVSRLNDDGNPEIGFKISDRPVPTSPKASG